MQRKISYKTLWLAGLICLGAGLLSIVFRPMWRDEYWALFFSEPTLSFDTLVSDRLVRDVHPPLYFMGLYLIRQILEEPLILRALNLLWLGGAAVLAWGLSHRRDRFLIAYLFFCLTSYWAIFFVAEVRPYALLYATCMVQCVVIVDLVRTDSYTLKRLIAFAMIGAIAGMLHYFAALLTALSGLCLGLIWLGRGEQKRFVVIGLASVVAIVPALVWIAISASQMSIDNGSTATFWQRAEFGIEQILRGIVVKTFGSNLALTVLAALGAAALVRKATAQAGLLAITTLGVIAIVYALHLFWSPLIKERAFIIIMPSLVWLMVEAARCSPVSPVTHGLFKAVPIVAAINPLIFAGEYFKDRERFAEVHALYQQYPACQKAEIYAFYRNYQHQAYYAFYTLAALTGPASSPGPALISVTGTDRVSDLSEHRGCPIEGVALGLRRGDEAMREHVRAQMFSAGINPDRTHEVRKAGGRHLIFIRQP